MNNLLAVLVVIFLIVTVSTSPIDDLTQSLKSLKEERQLRGLQVQVTKKQNIIYNVNLGQKNQANEPIDNHTMFRIASVSKSFSSIAILQLAQQGKLKLNQSLSSIFGFTIENPNFPGVDITIQMLLTHQSSIIECQPCYTNFLMATYNAKSGVQVPHIKEILTKGGKYYGDCLFSNKYKPGTHYQYVNLNFGIAGTIVEIISKQRFDQYQKEHILIPLSEGLEEIATFNAATIKNPHNLGIVYTGNSGKWVPNYDYYPQATIPQRNLTGYQIGTNGVIYGPQGGLRASVTHLSRYAIMLANGGKTIKGDQLLSSASIQQILRPRYQFHGLSSGLANDYHAYGFGIYSTTYRKNDIIINHEVVRGHSGAAYGLISAQHFWKDYTLTYIINGALNGYKYGTGTIYEYQRLAIHQSVQKYIKTLTYKANMIDES